jgi:hypothetical protein
MSVFAEKVYCVSFVQNHENKSLEISNYVILVPFLDMMFFRCGLYKIINFTNKWLINFTLWCLQIPKLSNSQHQA